MPKLAYCAVCKPPVPLAVGPLVRPPSHVVDGQKHSATMIEISSSDATLPQGKPAVLAKFMDRLLAKYVTKKS